MGRGEAGEGGYRPQAAPPGADPGRKRPRGKGSASACGAEGRGRGPEPGGAAAPPGHRVETGKGEAEHGLLQRPQEDEQGWCSCAVQAGSSRPSPASLRAPEGTGSSTRCGSRTKADRVPSPPRWPGRKETRVGRRQGRLS
ncbi:unnamed protein product [Rangifer tarandus platyrhynchus]|uniref:Uncharacterized protein n=2 Tax=Rangifer tarandus platyrhynchus TaxID=3082113 RepID=A0ABN8XZF8_RANTA|nr:unnamed protein product [Rangifer tarandus platyrhynchus]CAI9692530.1 unnamed protein product [Rangifer tarandus platyrhynchus]